MARCAFIKEGGERCEGSAKDGATLCYSHDPGRVEERRRNARKAGRTGGRGRRNLRVSAELAKLADRCEAVADGVEYGGLDRQDAAVIVQALNAARGCLAGIVKARELEEISDRLDALETAQAEKVAGKGQTAW